MKSSFWPNDLTAYAPPDRPSLIAIDKGRNKPMTMRASEEVLWCIYEINKPAFCWHYAWLDHIYYGN